MTISAKIIRCLRWIFYTGLSVAGMCAAIGMILFFSVIKDLPQLPEPLSRIIETPPTEIFATTGERIMLIGGREYVPLSRIAPHFIHAVIATEDHRFWEHHGVDKLRTLKALWITLFQPGKIQGASTITQQLAKNLFFSFERSYARKFQELLVAVQIESRYSKREILEAYLNQIPFGVGAMGVERAARTFFGKPASDLTLPESALLAGLPKSPTRYNPYRHFQRSKQRQRVVLQRMETVAYVSKMEAEQAYLQKLMLQEKSDSVNTGSYFLDKVVKDLEQRYGPDIVYHGGLKVSTTLDPRLQTIAIESIQAGLERLDRLIGIDHGRNLIADYPQGALVAVDANTGAVRALVGGRDYLRTEYNRALQHNRLPGSGFKPFLYYAAFEKMELNPASIYVDRPVHIPVRGNRDWKPQNFERKHEGAMVLKRALMKSVNTVAAQLVEKVGPESVIEVARRCGIKSRLDPVFSVALGTSGVSPLDMASAFATFATGGVRHEPFFVRRIEDAQGRILEEHIVSGKSVLDKRFAYQVVDMMRGVVDEGTGAGVRRMGFDRPAAGKTGTTDNFYDAWFTAFTPTLSTSVWVGHDRVKRLRDKNGVGITGGRAAAPIWAEFMLKATAGEPRRDFIKPDDIHFETVNAKTGCRTPLSDSHAIRVPLTKSQTVCETIAEAGKGTS